MMELKRKEFYTDDEHGEFEIPFTGEFSEETLQVSADGLTARLGLLCRDEDCEDPMNNTGDPDGTQFYQFSDRHRTHYTSRPDLEDWKRIIRRNPGRVFPLAACGDGWLPEDKPLTAAMCRGKKGTRGEECPAASVLDDADGYYIAPDDTSDPAKYAMAVMEERNAWIEGECYGVCVWSYSRATIDAEWVLGDRDECWGFIGEEHALEMLEDGMEHEG